MLQRLAWLSPAPIPEALLDVPVTDGENETDPFAALAELESYSLVTRSRDNPSFTVHRLVQEITRRQQNDPENTRLTEALRWLNTAFAGDPQDARNWPMLNPLLPHAQAVAGHADAAEITELTARLFNQLGIMYLTKSLYAEAEPLMRRALAIDKASFGPNHPCVATYLSNLAQLLKATNRLAETEPLIRRALAIDEANFDPNHPRVAVRLNNLAQLLQATNRLTEAEPLMRRALAIDETSFGSDHPNVAIDLNNLAQMLKATNRLTEAEPLMRRALAIDEASLGLDHPRVAIRLNNLARLLQDTNRLTEAEPLLRRALIILSASLGAEHPNTCIVKNNYAALLAELGKTEGEITAQLNDFLDRG